MSELNTSLVQSKFQVKKGLGTGVVHILNLSKKEIEECRSLNSRSIYMAYAKLRSPRQLQHERPHVLPQQASELSNFSHMALALKSGI